jgi:hypothetical protein
MSTKRRKITSLKLLLLFGVLTVLIAIIWLPSKPYTFAKNLLPLLFPPGSVHFSDMELKALQGTVTFHDFQLKQNPAFGDGILLESPRLEVRFKPFQTLSDNITLEYVHLDRPSLMVLAGPDGTLNVNLPASQGYAQFLHIKELRAPELQVIWIDQSAEDTYSELIATNISLQAFNIQLTGNKPANNLIDELIVEAPQMLFSRTGRSIRKRHDVHQLQVRKLKVRSRLFTYEEHNFQPEMLDIGISNLHLQAENLIIGEPLSTVVHSSPVDLTGQIVQGGSYAPLGIIGTIGPLDGRQTRVTLQSHTMGLQLETLQPLFKGDHRKKLIAGASLGGSVFDLNLSFKGTLAELSCHIETESARGSRTDSTFVLRDADYQNRVFWNNLAYFLSQPKSAGIPASAEGIPVDIKVKAWHANIHQRAEERFERSRKERPR